MTTPTSRLAYKVHYELFEQAHEDPVGIRIRQPDYGKAHRLRQELHHARVLDRRENAQTYEEGHQLHGRSAYDVLRCTIENIGEEWWLYIRHSTIDLYDIEPLSAVEEPTDIIEVPEPIP